MNLNHLNLCTKQVQSLSQIFTRHFDFQVLEVRDDFATLQGPNGFLLVLTQTAADSPQLYPYTYFAQFNFRFNFHVGFTIDSAEAVRAKHQELYEAGLVPGAITEYQAMGAAWTAFYCSVGDGIDIEVNTKMPL